MPWDSSECISDGVATAYCLFPLFQNILSGALAFAGLVALVFVIYSAFKLITSGGDAKKVAGARNTLMFAIIGLLLIIFSYFILSMVANLTGVNCILKFSFSNCSKSSTPIGGGHPVP